MKAIHQTNRSHRGSTLIAVLGYVFLTSGLVATILTVGSTHRQVSFGQLQMEQAMFVAEGGVERGVRFIESNLVTLAASSTGATNGTGVIGSGTYTFSVSRVNSATFSIISTGTVNGIKRWVKINRVYQPTYAEFALWSHNNGGLYFKSGEIFDGRVHADDQLWFSGNPIFQAAVTSLASSYGGSISSVQFDDTFTLNSYQGTMADVDFNSSASTSLKNIAQSTGLVLDGNTTITFSGNNVKITNTRASYSNYSWNPSGITEKIIYIRNATSGTTSTRPGIAYLLGGNVTGRLTIVTEDDMYIRGNITYTNNPLTKPNSKDALGLISRDDILVDTTAPNNLTIQAALMATGAASSSDDGSFSVINYNTGSSRGTLTILGGLVQETRGAVGTFNQSTGLTVTGFGKDYSYDPRFVDDPPPYYPIIAGKVEFSQWKEGR